MPPYFLQPSLQPHGLHAQLEQLQGFPSEQPQSGDHRHPCASSFSLSLSVFLCLSLPLSVSLCLSLNLNRCLCSHCSSFYIHCCKILFCLDLFNPRCKHVRLNYQLEIVSSCFLRIFQDCNSSSWFCKYYLKASRLVFACTIKEK